MVVAVVRVCVCVGVVVWTCVVGVCDCACVRVCGCSVSYTCLTSPMIALGYDLVSAV